MKKYLLIGFSIILMLSGCGKDSFEHYDLRNASVYPYTYNGTDHYVLSDITPENSESILTGLFYQIDYKDYILLETLESSTVDAYKNSSMYQFYDDKMYGVGNGDTPMIFEIDLKGKKSTMRELNFKVKGTDNNIFGNIDLIKREKNYLYFRGYIFIDEHSYKKDFICSLIDYQCEFMDTNEE